MGLVCYFGCEHNATWPSVNATHFELIAQRNFAPLAIMKWNTYLLQFNSSLRIITIYKGLGDFLIYLIISVNFH